MELIRRQPIVFIVLAIIVGWAIGLFAFGWYLTPVEYTGAGPQDLLGRDQDNYLRALADLFAFDNNRDRINRALGAWPEADQAICRLAAESTDQAEVSRLIALAAVRNGVGCTDLGAGPVTQPVGGEDEGGGLSTLVVVCGLLLLLLVIVGAIVLVWLRRGRAPTEPGAGYAEVPTAGPLLESAEAEAAVTPIARFQTTFARGHDTYDDSFSIENANGDFLGECGVGLSETIGAETPKNVTAFEVWLFDKNDIRTVTKVVMSDHAFFDEAIKAKLAPKGEPVLARPGETIVLETASLIINAEITEMEYGVGTLPPQSFFERFTVELSAWAKEGEFDEPDVQGRIDEMLEF